MDEETNLLTYGGRRFGIKLLVLIMIIESAIVAIGLTIFGSNAILPPNNSTPPSTAIVGVWIMAVAVGLVPVIALTLARRRLGELNAAAWLVLYGTLVIIGEHPFFAIGYTVPTTTVDLLGPVALGPLFPHARFHFFMSGVFTIVALVLLAAIAFQWLREGKRNAWYAIMTALVLGGGSELTLGLLIYPHGFAVSVCNQGACNFSIPIGLYLYSYIVAWIAALVISYKPIFHIR